MTNPGFGRVFSEHMVISDYEASSGWSTPILQPYGPITLDPAASILHYGQSIFEGLKCYAQKNGNVALFRPVENWKRMNESALRLAMPSIPKIFLYQQRKRSFDKIDLGFPTNEEKAYIFAL